MLLLISIVFSAPQCNLLEPHLHLNTSLQSWTQVLSAGDCIILNASGRNSRFAYWVAASSKSIRIRRDSCQYPGTSCYLSYVGETPDAPLYEKIRFAWVNYYFTALSNDTLFSITYVDLYDFQCHRVILNTKNPWTFIADQNIVTETRICLVPCFPYPKTVKITAGNKCRDGQCGTFTIYEKSPTQGGLNLNVTDQVNEAINPQFLSKSPFKQNLKCIKACFSVELKCVLS
jgi:hypothetical protein